MRFIWLLRAAGVLLAPALFAQQLNEHCTVSILNRIAQVKPNGSWHIDNIPFTPGALRARSACVDGGVTVLGQTDIFNVPRTLQVGVDAVFNTGVTPIPTSLQLTAPVTKLTTPNQTVPLKVMGTYAN